MKKTLKKIYDSELNQWQLFTDLVSILSLFGGIFYIGGYKYVRSYFDSFFMNPSAITSNILFCITTFIDQIILRNLFALIIAMLIASVFIIFYYYARNILKSWWGYISICVAFLLIFLVIIWVAGIDAQNNALRDWDENSSHLPRVNIILDDHAFDKRLITMGYQSVLRLVYEGDEFLYLFKPRKPDDQSDLPVYIIPKKYVIQLEIFNIRNE